MEFRSNRRILIFSSLAVVLFVLLVMQLADLTLAQGSNLDAQSETKTKKTISITGSRGTIMDKNGIPLAYDEKCYNVQFTKDPTRTTYEDRAYYTDILLRAIDIIEKNGGKTINTFSIVRNDNGEFVFDFKIQNPVAIAKREKNWRRDMYVPVETYPTPENIYNYLRKKYQIPEELSYSQAQKLLSIWQEVQLNASKMYQPVDIAYKVNIATVAKLKTYSNELDGIDVSQGTVRMYPKGNVAAHTIGYLGKINDKEEIEEKGKLGYEPGDLIGVSGIEQYMESYLTSNINERKGSRQVEVSRTGKIMRYLTDADKPAESGQSVMLTIDLNLQRALEDVLERDIIQIQKKQQEVYEEKKAHYDEVVAKRSTKDKPLPIKYAKSGAAVVLDANSGKVLAIASYPSYDLNLFTGGISEEDYKPLTDKDSAPLFNKAVSSKGTPGSIMKMMTGLAGLMEGKLLLSDRISDKGPYGTGGQPPTKDSPECWAWPTSKHNNQDLPTALKNSCNYFFFTVAERLGIDKLNVWAQKLGLTSKTGIELPMEATGQIGNQKTIYDSSKSIKDQPTSLPKLVFIQIKGYLKDFGQKRNVQYTDAELDDCTNELMKLVDKLAENKEVIGPDIRRILSEKLGIPQGISQEKNWEDQIALSLVQLRWTPNMTIVSGIGQGVAAVTPVEIARYVAAIVNGGTVYNVHIVDKIIDPDGKIVKQVQPEVFSTLDAKPEYLDAIKKGMGEVVSATDNGTAADYFKNFEYVNDMGGKTGTAQVSDIDIENNSWFVAFTPYEKPEIVVVSYIPHGYSGGQSSLIARDIIQYYRDNQKRKAIDDIPVANNIVGDLYEDKDTTDTQDDKDKDKDKNKQN
jgi:penicillin-binding protein 2